ncbi:MAG: DUF1572 domain-containing protein [Saprospiraceae bacterium]|nr:DUF1572 domain-containing protein [Saprospiraceae bacterium]
MESYLSSVKKQFQYYKSLADKAMTQISDVQLDWQPNEASNSIAIIVKHMVGNMLSRWTDFLTSDGEKPWRNRESEFEGGYPSREAMLEHWERGWKCLFDALESLTETDLERIIYIRNEGHTVMEAINRQLAHYPYHVGQIVYLARLQANEDWKSLSIPKGGSEVYNADKFAQEKAQKHFTDGMK